jgi:hypothetical protein
VVKYYCYYFDVFFRDLEIEPEWYISGSPSFESAKEITLYSCKEETHYATIFGPV